MKKTGIIKRIVKMIPAALAVGCMVFSECFVTADAADSLITLDKVITLALALDADYQDLKTEIAAKSKECESAVSAVKMKGYDNSTYRWTPLATLSLPEDESLTEQYSYEYKPYKLQTELSAKTHKLITLKYDSRADVSEMYAQTYALVQTVDTAEERDEYLARELAREEALYKKGSIPKATIEETENEISDVENKLAETKTTLIACEEELGDNIGFELTSSSTLEDPMPTLTLSRDYLSDWIDSAVENDQDLYEQRMATEAARLSMETTYNLMYSKYGSKISPMASYISQAEDGHSINQAVMKRTYEDIITEIQNESDGTVKIMGMKLQKEWLMGDNSGIRYIEDDPEVLYTAILEYIDSRSDTEAAEEELSKSIKEQYNKLVSSRRSYNVALSAAKDSTDDRDRKEQLNKLGKCTDSDLKEAYASVYESECALIDAKLEYTNALFEMDRTTCGGVSDTISDLANERSDTLAEVSRVIYDTTEGSSYYILSLADQNSFEIGINLADELVGYITDFELWVDGEQIGERTDINKSLVHLALTTQGSDNVVLRFYSFDVFVDDCEINSLDTHGQLDIKTNLRVEESEETIGTFSYTVNRANRTIELTVTPDISQNLHYYSVSDENGLDLLSGRILPVSESFTYLSAMAGNIGDITVTFYDVRQQKVCDAKLINAGNSIIRVNDDETEEETEIIKAKTKTDTKTDADTETVTDIDTDTVLYADSDASENTNETIENNTNQTE